MFREHRPQAPALLPLVERVWTLRTAPGEGPGLQRVLPDGCMDILFSLGSAPREEGGEGRRPPSYVVGAMTGPQLVRHQGGVDLVGVRFRPGAAPAFLEVPAHEVTDGILPLDAAWAGLAAEARERLGEAERDDARVAALEGVLLRVLKRGRGRLDAAVVAACRAVEDTLGPLGVDALTREAGVGRRQFERRFRTAVGLSPGTAVRVQRFRRALVELRRPGATLAGAALAAGYYDQPHLTRDFRALAGTTPGRWRGARGAPDGDASVQDAAGAGA